MSRRKRSKVIKQAPPSETVQYCNKCEGVFLSTKPNYCAYCGEPMTGAAIPSNVRITIHVD